ncbi:NBS-LRR type resistance protein [Cucumis melo var. makuwa]|uniref:NBS-LRR type resistance protein n=1 Tax=Cucumis melo var. makuwa TaxID=1194695 RepID=A0A5A7UN33_CUCMM|nr:NBS-LRR type resistance protein [Cucumis melo var. makuwa]
MRPYGLHASFLPLVGLSLAVPLPKKGTLHKQSSGSVERTHQSRDPEGCTYQSSDPEGYTYQSGDPEGYTYQSSAPLGCTYQSSDPERYTYQCLRILEMHERWGWSTAARPRDATEGGWVGRHGRTKDTRWRLVA